MLNFRRNKILIVDDVAVNRIVLEEILSNAYDIVQAESGREAIEMLLGDEQSEAPDLVILDIMMPEINGFEVLKLLKNDPRTHSIPVFIVTASEGRSEELKGLALGAADYISRPFAPETVRYRIDNYMELLRYRTNLQEQVDKKVSELSATKDHMLEMMANIIEYRNLESGRHVRHTTALSEILINYMMTKQQYFKELYELDYKVIIKAAPMHDIGKIAIPDSILLKPEKLTPEEFEIIKTHTTVGGQIIESMMDKSDDIYFKHCHDISLYHHERWDGKGYPTGISGEDIPLSARILAIVDVYDALVSTRSYKEAYTHEEAMEILKNGAGTQFDPDIIETLMEIQDRFKDCV